MSLGTLCKLAVAALAAFVPAMLATSSALANSAPAFTAATATRSVDENAPAGANVGAPVTATDADGDTLTYSLSGTDASSFDIGSSSGQITVATATTLDYETDASYSVTVTATDTYSATGSVVVTIEVGDIREAGPLGRIVITVGSSGSRYGYDSGSYGTLDSGSFPSALFGDGNSRTVAEIYEDDDGYWYFTYSGGTADDWNDDQEHLDEITVEVTYEDETDSRSFVLGGFIDSRLGQRGLKLDPPLPGRDWDTLSGEEVAIDFRRHRSQAVAPTVRGSLTEPEGTANSFIEFLSSSTPGGPVIAQTLIVILVYGMFIFKAPATPWGIILAVVVLVMTPWVPVLFGFGSTIAAGIILVNVLAGAFSYKAFAARTES